jgi:hypothetical protein
LGERNKMRGIIAFTENTFIIVILSVAKHFREGFLPHPL